jgi:hypothetical protein
MMKNVMGIIQFERELNEEELAELRRRWAELVGALPVREASLTPCNYQVVTRPKRVGPEEIK